VLTFEFALYYSFSTLFGVLTRSPVVAILMTCLLWFILFLTGWTYGFLEATRKPFTLDQPATPVAGADGEWPQAPRGAPGEKLVPDWLYTTVDVVHFVLPRMKDTDFLLSKLVVSGIYPADAPQRREAEKAFASFRWTEALTVSGIFLAVMLGLACWRFSTRDY
jgi:hypothetical protein